VEELADGFHFYIALLIALDLTAEDLFQVYFKKSEVNKFRQRSGY
jgi:dimeric dUTPase (all-alpha-NTP-PPase superfamily)